MGNIITVVHSRTYPRNSCRTECLARQALFFTERELRRRRRRHLAGRKVRRPRGAAFSLSLSLSLSLLVINYMRQNGEDGRKEAG